MKGHLLSRRYSAATRIRLPAAELASSGRRTGVWAACNPTQMRRVRSHASPESRDSRTEISLDQQDPSGSSEHGMLAKGKTRRWPQVLGLDPSAELVAISMVYFVQGILGLARLALSFFYKDTLQIDPAEVAMLTGLAGLPWMVKPLYGFISDSIPLFGYRRRSYLVLAGIAGTVSWATLATFASGTTGTAACLLLGSLSTAASDVLVDSIVVERARGAPPATAGSLQSLCWGSSAVGGIISAYFSGALVEHYGTRVVFGLTAIFPLVVSCSALLIDEKRVVLPSSRGRASGYAALPTDAAATLELGALPGALPASGLTSEPADAETAPLLSPAQGETPQPTSHAHHSPPQHGATGHARGLPGAGHTVPATDRLSPHSHSSGSGPAHVHAPLTHPPFLDPPEVKLRPAPMGPSPLLAAGREDADVERAQPGASVQGGWEDEGPLGLGPGPSSLRQLALAQGKALLAAVSRKEILLPTLFVFLWQSTPSAESAMFYFQTNELGFTPEFLGRVRLVGALASLAGVLLYNGALKKVPLRTFLWWSMLLGVVLGSTQLLLVSRANLALGLSDQLFVLGDSVVLTVLGQASFMPILVLAARMCPEGVEATLFATLMSVLNAGGLLGSTLGAGLTKALGVTSDNFDNLFTLVLLCNLATLLPAPFLRLLPSELDQDPEDEKAAAASAPAAEPATSIGSTLGSTHGMTSTHDSDGIHSRPSASAAGERGRIGGIDQLNGSPSGLRAEQLHAGMVDKDVPRVKHEKV